MYVVVTPPVVLLVWLPFGSYVYVVLSAAASWLAASQVLVVVVPCNESVTKPA